MSKPTSRPLLPIVVLLCLGVPLLIPPAAEGAPWTGGNRAESFFAWIWGALPAVWGEAGCGFDPDGRCGDRPVASESPGGRQVTANEGCGFDPDGRCRDGLAGLRGAGCLLDPFGSCAP